MNWELARRCGELAGVLHEETGLRVEVQAGPLGPMWDGWKVRVGGAGGPRWWFSDEEILSVEPSELADRISSEVNERLRPPAGEDGQYDEDDQQDEDNGVGALTGHVHGDLLLRRRETIVPGWR
jgi:hypothetical protein